MSAIGKGKSSRGKSAIIAKTSRSHKAGLQFPVGRLSRFMRHGKFAERIGAGAPVYMLSLIHI